MKPLIPHISNNHLYSEPHKCGAKYDTKDV